MGGRDCRHANMWFSVESIGRIPQVSAIYLGSGQAAIPSWENQMIKVEKEHTMRHCNKRWTRNGTGEKSIVKLKAQKAAAIRGRKAENERNKAWKHLHRKPYLRSLW